MLLVWAFRAVYVLTVAAVPFALAGLGMDFANVAYGCFVASSVIISGYLINGE